jgi:serine/threonine protein kinase
MQPLPIIPGYELVQPLGGGPLTCVYSAREFSADELCAIKALRPKWQQNATAIKLLQREARAGLAIRHPHLVGFRDAHVTRPPYFLVMDLLPGESLRRRLRRDYRLDVRSALWIARQTAEALTALHRAGFVHGDVKPDNIRLIDAGTAVLMDLGFAHRPGENARLRRHGYLLGTVNYLAPELCDFSSDADFRSDLFSLGVTLFEMLAGKLPFPDGNTAQTLQWHRNNPPANVRDFAEPIPSALAALVDRLLAHNLEERPRAPAVLQQLIALEITTLRQRQSA